MPTLPVDLDQAERAIRSAIAAKWQSLGYRVHTVTRYSDSLGDWLRVVGVSDGSRQVARAALITFRGWQPMRDDATCAETPIRLRYRIEIVRTFHDGTPHSEDDFVAKLMSAYIAFERDHTLGFDDCWHTSLEAIDDARVEDFDGHLAHRITLGLDCEVRRQ